MKISIVTVALSHGGAERVAVSISIGTLLLDSKQRIY